jgi:hypothetical protein
MQHTVTLHQEGIAPEAIYGWCEDFRTAEPTIILGRIDRQLPLSNVYGSRNGVSSEPNQ